MNLHHLSHRCQRAQAPPLVLEKISQQSKERLLYFRTEVVLKNQKKITLSHYQKLKIRFDLMVHK